MSEPLTVVVCVDHGSITGGQAKVAIESAIGMKRAGLRVIFFAAAAPVDPRLQEEGVEVACLGQTDLLGNPSRAAAMIQGTWNTDAAKALRELLAKLPADRTVVHVHGWARALSPSIAPAIAQSKLPALYTVHEYFLFCPNGGFYNYQTNVACSLEPLSPACFATHCDQRNYVRKLWRGGRLLLANHFARLPQVFSDYVCISNFQRDVIAPFIPKSARLHHVSNPIDAVDRGPKENPASGDFIFLGRLSPEKGPLLFAEAAARIGQVATFVGDGPMTAEIAQRFPDARLLGWKSPDEAAEALRNARALVFPSLWYEGQPLTVLEAKAMGTPVIVSNGCAGREEVADDETGLWFNTGDAFALARAIGRLKDDATVARMSRAAYDDFWRDPPTLSRHVERIVAIYEEMLSRRAAAA
ncbi:glycosyltransferase family 4 protein [Methylocystis sp. WRRC1]|uniref:glycosyltransferase family 4 protein n=1 Tax=Methylocystis sp. WRRC1 TaxID=1732014 RepID=UPI001D14E3D5|nr:glycosyltransferase family 4 protein [Methylocystis sp. WRRC1]MCC3246927.1 glycosyltransferase family 4 protein [Methylocystis sp. WRRC1]